VPQRRERSTDTAESLNCAEPIALSLVWQALE
jgi:hypothetical protein